MTGVGFVDPIYLMDLQTLKNKTPAESIVGLLNCTRFCGVFFKKSTLWEREMISLKPVWSCESVDKETTQKLFPSDNKNTQTELEALERA